MLNANVFGEGVCYTDITHRKLVVLNILKNCHRIISEASNIKRIDEIIASNFFNVNSSDKSSFREFSSLVQSLNPAIIDAIRICVCFENFFKAKLILNGYIIHKIIKNQLISKYQCLATKQKSQPIKISKIKEAEGLKWKRGVNYNFKSLAINTLDFNTFLKKKNYQAKIRVPKDLFNILDKIKKKRNTLHYLVNDDRSYSNIIIKELQIIKRYFNNQIVPMHNKLVDDLGYPSIHNIKII